MSRIAPSLLAADFTRLADELERFRRSGAEILHLDVMDGDFVSGITFGSDLVKALRPLAPDAIFDVHLMVTHPLRQIERFCRAGADYVTVHTECCDDVAECLRAIRACGARPGVSIKPATPASAVLPYLGMIDLCLVMTVEPGLGGQAMIYECLDKLGEIRKAADDAGSSLLLSVDGGVREDNCAFVAGKGADIIVAGSAAFGASDMESAVRRLTGLVGG